MKNAKREQLEDGRWRISVEVGGHEVAVVVNREEEADERLDAVLALMRMQPGENRRQ